MKKIYILLSMTLITVIFSGCSFFDSVIGGVASIHTTRIVLDVPSGGASQDSDQVFSKNRDILLEQVRSVALTHHFADMTTGVSGVPKPIAHFETVPPWALFISVFETNKQLSVVLWQYYDKRKQTPQYKEAGAALENILTNHFVDRLEIQRQRELRYPWQSD